jgi:hypothetical protein
VSVSEKMAALKMGLESQENVLRKQFSGSSTELRASYHFTYTTWLKKANVSAMGTS